MRMSIAERVFKLRG